MKEFKIKMYVSGHHALCSEFSPPQQEITIPIIASSKEDALEKLKKNWKELIENQIDDCNWMVECESWWDEEKPEWNHEDIEIEG